MIGKLILGTAQIGLSYGIGNIGGKPTPEKAKNILESAYYSGIKTIDTADGYGEAINIISNFHRENPKFNIITKFHGINNGDILKVHLNEIIAKLKVDFLYCVMFHRFDEYENSPQLMKTLINMRNNGLIHKIGISVYSNSEFENAIQQKEIDVIQFPFNILDNFNIRGKLIINAKEKNKELHVRSIFLQGLLLLSIDKIPQNLKSLVPYIIKAQNVASYLRTDIKTAAMQYVFQNPYVDKIVFGAESTEQVIANVELTKKVIPYSSMKEFDSISVIEQDLLNPTNWNR